MKSGAALGFLGFDDEPGPGPVESTKTFTHFAADDCLGSDLAGHRGVPSVRLSPLEGGLNSAARIRQTRKDFKSHLLAT